MNGSSIGDGVTSALLDGANSLPIVLFKKWGKSLGIKMEFFLNCARFGLATCITFSIKWIQSLDITMEGGRAGPGGDCEAIGEDPSSSRG